MLRFKFLFIVIISLFSCIEDRKMSIENVKQLSFQGDNGEAYFNSDDSKVIFQSKRNNNNCDKLYIVDINGNNLTEFVANDGAFTCAYFSLDDRYIFFSSTMHLGSECPEIYKDPNPRKYIWPLRDYEIFRYDNGAVKQLTNYSGYNAETTTHPFEEKVIFTSLRDGDINLFEMDYNGENVKQITSEYGYDGGAFYSPNGENIVWRAWYPTSDEEISMWKNNLAKKFIESVPLDIYVAKNDGSEKQRLTSNGATNWAPSWHPDGKHIVFSSNMDDWREDYNAYGSNFELYMINIATKTLTRLTNNDTFDSFSVFSKNGKKIVFSSNRDAENPRNTNIFIADIVYK